jgi:FixJ family two-component response regulator
LVRPRTKGQLPLARARRSIPSEDCLDTSMQMSGDQYSCQHSGVVAIVEDDAAMRRSIERLLRASGYATVAFASAEDFLASAAIDNAMVVVLDIHLGGMSGIELRRHLSAAGSTPPVVFITAFDDEATRAEAMATGCVDYLQKPFDASRLTQALDRVSKQRDN